jgi:hypothetical protein
MCMRIANGSGWENMFFNPPNSFREWQPIISQWDSVHVSMPRINWVCSNLLWDSANAPAPHALHVKEQWRFMRWTLGMALWGGAYFMIQENEHNNSLWYDECSADLGHPTGPPQQLSNGCYVRFFDKGVSILNAASGTQTVSAGDLAGLTGYQGPYYRFRGNQDPLVNDGSLFASVTLVATAAARGGDPVGDGIILLTTPQTIVSDIIVDDAPDGTSPGSQPAEMSGFAWDQQASSQDNPTWTTGPSWDNDPAHHRSHIAPPGSGSATAVYRPAINLHGKYTVYEWHGWAGATPSSLAEASNVPCRIVHANGATDLTIDQTTNYGRWNALGTYHFKAGGGASVMVSNNANGYVVADAFRFVYAGADSTFDLNGQIFFDRDGDGRKEPGEPGLPGWVVRLEGPFSASAVSDSAGHFEFDDNPPGTYALREDRQPFWQETLPSPPDTTYQFTAGGDLSVIERNFGNYATGAVELPVRASWNAISVPLVTGDRRRTSLFPTATSDAFAYLGLYIPEDTMNYGTGYWLKFSGNENLWLAGTAFGRDTIAADTGWNFFGSISSPVAAGAITTVPPGILRSAIWAFRGSYYPADSIRPGTASWVNVYPSGVLILEDSAGPPAAAKTERDRLAGLNVLLFTNAAGESARLYFSGRTGDRDLVSWFKLPPLPPGGTFDVRFLEPAGNSLVAALGGREPEVPIAVQSAVYPIRVTWNLLQDGVRYELKAEGGSFSALGREGMLSLEAPAGGSGVPALMLRLQTGGNGAGSIPASFEMRQNFPNPFNGQTVFTLSLPSDGHLKLEIFNVLGERVQTLIDDPMEAGSHTVPFSASDLTSGVYFYRVDFTPSAGQVTRKYGRMLLIR